MGKLTPKMETLLTWLSGGPKLESQVIGSGLSSTLDNALRMGWCDMQPSAAIKDGKVPAAECVITDRGRSALKEAEG